MLINLEGILRIAEEKNYAIASINTPNLECIMAVINVAQKYDVPIIISHAQVHEPIMPLEIIGPIMVSMARKSSVQICVHLDHGESLDYLKRSLEIGFTSIMYDGSSLDYEQNVANTKYAIDMAKEYNASVEAEIGTMGHRETGAVVEVEEEKLEAIYTDPLLASRFVNQTKVHALAASFGTVHGIYKTEPNLDFDRIKQIKELTDVPLVMHGGSGVSNEDYKKAIAHGIRKINYYSYMAIAGGASIREATKEKEINYFHDLACVAIDAMERDIERIIKPFYNK